MTMLEKCARALAGPDADQLVYPRNWQFARSSDGFVHVPNHAEPKPLWTKHIEHARAVLLALREPDERMCGEMENAATVGIGKCIDDEAIKRVWRAGVDSILKEPKA